MPKCAKVANININRDGEEYLNKSTDETISYITITYNNVHQHKGNDTRHNTAVKNFVDNIFVHVYIFMVFLFYLFVSKS